MLNYQQQAMLDVRQKATKAKLEKAQAELHELQSMPEPLNLGSKLGHRKALEAKKREVRSLESSGAYHG